MATKKTDINTEISRCINQLLLKEPFYAHILAGTVREVTTKIPTAAVGFNNELIKLMVNETFFLNELKSVSERVAVLKHETLHLVFRHLFRDKISEDPELFNIAADLVVNQYIGTWKLPDSALTLKLFPDLNLKSEMNLEYYYNILQELKKANEIAAANCNGNESTNGIDSNSGNQDSSSANSNNKKSDQKQPLNEKCPISAAALASISNTTRHSDHSYWVIKDGIYSKTANGEIVDGNAIVGAEQAINRQLLDSAARTASKYYGSLPGDIQTQINIIRESMKPKIDWKRMLKIFSSANGRSVIYHTMKRVSKRYGTRPGIRIKRFKNIAVVIDTSGSIELNTLQQFFHEIDSIHRNGASVYVIECDAAVNRQYPYKPGKSIEVSGGGGTNYDPAFALLKKNRSSKFDACIYLTDGYAPEPTVKPGCSLLYVISPGGKLGPHLKWGKSICMK